MNERSDLAIGIDLGTTYSAVAYLNDLGRPQTVVNVEGDKLTPSAVLFDGPDTIVGKEAIKALGTEADHVADCAKRDLGYRLYRKILSGRQYPPEAIQAVILNKLRWDAQRQIGPCERVVITVPAYFDEVRRKATQDAGYMAGLTVMDIINEPTAAAVAFGFQRGFLRHDADMSQTENVLVYDLGGGTFDVTVMEIRGNEFTTLATDGDVQLGGRDWDQRLLDYVAEECIRQMGADPREDPNVTGRLWRECEDAKRTLSARHKARVSCDYKGHSVVLEVTRQTFEDMTRDLLDRTGFTVRLTLQAAGLQWPEVSRVLLIGGSSRMPAVSEMLRTMSGHEPDLSVPADEAVAHGAALHAGVLLQKDRGESQLRIKNVNSHSLGVVGRDSKTKRPRNAILIPRNTPLPVKAKRVFKTQKAGQKSIRVQIVEGESAGSPEDCSEIGKCTVPSLPPNLPAQTPIEVEFAYEANGRLTILVRVAGEVIQHEMTRENSLSPEQLDSWRQYISGLPW